VDPEGSLIETD